MGKAQYNLRMSIRALFLIGSAVFVAVFFQNAANLKVLENGAPTWDRLESVKGSIISIGNDGIAGWAFDSSDANNLVNVSVIVDSVMLGTLRVDQPLDVLDNALCEGCGKGFRIPLPNQFIDSLPHTIVLRSASGAVLDQTTFLLAGSAPINFVGTSANESIVGGPLNDSFTMMDGDDEVHGGSGDDQILGNVGDDLLFGDDGSDTLFGGRGNDTLFGNVGADTLWGDLGDDTLFGGRDNDILNGGDGNDTLSGDLGDDQLLGGVGDDTYLYKSGDGNDTIDDTSGANVLSCANVRGSIQSVGNGQLISFPGGGSILLLGQTRTTMDVSSCIN